MSTPDPRSCFLNVVSYKKKPGLPGGTDDSSTSSTLTGKVQGEPGTSLSRQQRRNQRLLRWSQKNADLQILNVVITRKKNFVTMCGDHFAIYTHIKSCSHLKWIQCYMSIISPPTKKTQNKNQNTGADLKGLSLAKFGIIWTPKRLMMIIGYNTLS